MSLTIILLCAIIAIILIKKYEFLLQFWRKKRYLTKIPGPRGYPLIGNLLELGNGAEVIFKQDRERNLKYYPIFKFQILQDRFVNLINPYDIELVLTNTKHITKGPVYDLLHDWLGTGLLTSTGSKWKNRRRILTPAFHFNILQEFINIFNEETQKLVNDLKQEADKPFIDVVPPITQFTLWSIAETAMGLTLNMTDQEKERYKNAVYKTGNLFIQRAPKPWLYLDFIYYKTKNGKEAKATLDILHNVSRNVIRERKKQFSNSSYSTRKRLAMLDLLLSHQAQNGDIDEEGLREEVDTFMFEGHDTTSMAICFTLMLLANHKTTQEEIYKEIIEVLGPSDQLPDYTALQNLNFMERCLKECLRLYPSVPAIARVAGEDIKTKTGYLIPKNCVVNIFIYDLHHNPNVYPDPEKFDPDRFLPENMQERHPFAYIPFSGGSRNCIGQKFAMLEMKAVLCGILRNFVLEAVDTPEDMVFISDLVLRPKGSIRVKFVPRN